MSVAERETVATLVRLLLWISFALLLVKQRIKGCLKRRLVMKLITTSDLNSRSKVQNE